MPYSFDEEELKRSLSRLSLVRVSGFSASCSVRLAREAMRLRPSGLSSDVLAEAIEAIWRMLESDGNTDTAALEERLLNAIAEEDEDGSFEGAVVEDACAALVYAMRSTREGDAKNAVWSARRAYETTDRYASAVLQETTYDADAEMRILNNEVVQLELRRQERDLSVIKSLDRGDVGVIATLKAFSAVERILDSGDVE